MRWQRNIQTYIHTLYCTLLYDIDGDIYKHFGAENKISITKVVFKDVLNEYFRITKHRSISREEYRNVPSTLSLYSTL